MLQRFHYSQHLSVRRGVVLLRIIKFATKVRYRMEATFRSTLLE